MKLILIAALCAATVAHAQSTWKIATGYRAESFHTENIAQFGREVEAATKGQLRIELAPNGSLFKLGDIRQAVEDGKVQAGDGICSGPGLRKPSPSVACRYCMPCRGHPRACTPPGPSRHWSISNT